MKRDSIKWVIFGALVCAGFVSPGCKSVRPGVTKINNAVILDTGESPGRVERAAMIVLEDLHQIIVEVEHDDDVCTIDSHDRQGTKYIVTIEAKSPARTRIMVRIKPGHNENASRIVLERIEKELGLR